VVVEIGKVALDVVVGIGKLGYDVVKRTGKVAIETGKVATDMVVGIVKGTGIVVAGTGKFGYNVVVGTGKMVKSTGRRMSKMVGLGDGSSKFEYEYEEEVETNCGYEDARPSSAYTPQPLNQPPPIRSLFSRGSSSDSTSRRSSVDSLSTIYGQLGIVEVSRSVKGTVLPRECQDEARQRGR
jgi:hypothetical protein